MSNKEVQEESKRMWLPMATLSPSPLCIRGLPSAMAPDNKDNNCTNLLPSGDREEEFISRQKRESESVLIPIHRVVFVPLKRKTSPKRKRRHCSFRLFGNYVCVATVPRTTVLTRLFGNYCSFFDNLALEPNYCAPTQEQYSLSVCPGLVNLDKSVL